jgi:hypothetical protein
LKSIIKSIFSHVTLENSDTNKNEECGEYSFEKQMKKAGWSVQGQETSYTIFVLLKRKVFQMR